MLVRKKYRLIRLYSTYTYRFERKHVAWIVEMTFLKEKKMCCVSVKKKCSLFIRFVLGFRYRATK